MKSKLIGLVALIVLLGAGMYLFNSRNEAGKSAVTDTGTKTTIKTPSKKIAAFDPKNATYENIDDMNVTLVNGQADTPAEPGSATVITTQYFGNDAHGDINGDDLSDTAFLLVQYGGGTGTFYYVVAAVRDGDNYKVTNAVFLGDRIAPQTTEIKNGLVVVNYADRKPGQAMVETPTVGKTKYLKVNAAGELVETTK